MLPVLDPSLDPDVRPVIADTAALPSFDAAARATLRFLQDLLPAGAWMVTRVSGADWVVLRVLSPGYAIGDGDVHVWSDSFCSRMVRGEGPRIAPRAQEVPAYAAAPIGQLVPIGGYVGIPLTAADGRLLGTLCAIDPEPLPEHYREQQPMLELQARLLSSLLDLELDAARQHRERPAEVLPASSLDELLATTGGRLARHASPASVLVVTGVGRLAEPAVLSVLAGGEVAVRLTDDSCAVLLTELSEGLAQRRATAVLEQLHRLGIDVCVGVAGVDPRTSDLHDAVVRARRDAALAA